MPPLFEAKGFVLSFPPSLLRLMFLRARKLAIILAASAMTGCYGDSSSQDGGGSQLRYPAGLATDTPSLHAMSGVYPAASDDNTCCWLSGDAHFFLPVEPGATSLMIEVYVPPVGPLSTNPGKISVLDEHGKTVATKMLRSGVQSLVLPLASRTGSAGRISIRLHMSTAFVPKDLGLNGDIRRLSIVLTSVQLSNAPA